ncbi:hypothetical protein V5799_011757 [Amblyomma americanum]|uniref:Uncharacterized protein n=1 Tax=Amblyomma americanum TaxID=6943 RepID=A0AAQ4EG88_AMBAM
MTADDESAPLLEPGRTFRLAQSTGTSYTNIAFRCITATAIDKSDAGYKVTTMVSYAYPDSENWPSYNRTFKFECASGTYSKMNSIEEDGATSLSYQFFSTDPSCTIVEDITPQPSAIGKFKIIEQPY